MIRIFRDPHFQNPAIRRNFILNWTDGAFFAFGMSFVPIVTVLPVFVQKIGGGSLAVSLIQVIWIIGFNIPQILISNTIRHQPYKKKVVLLTALFQRLPWALLAFISFFFINRISSRCGLWLFFLVFAMAALAGAMNFPGWFDLISKITPVTLRGRLFALRTITGALLGVMGGWMVKHILQNVSFPHNFSMLFLLAFVMMTISYFALMMLKENEPNAADNPLTLKAYFRILPGLLAEDKNFLNFLIADSCMTIGLISQPFYILNAMEKFHLSPEASGTFTVVFMAGLVIWNFCFGPVGDRFGHRINLLIASIVIFINSLLAISVQTLAVFYVIFFLDALIMSMVQVSRFSIIAEFCGTKERPTYIALANMVTSPFILLGLIGGLLADSFGYYVVFLIAGFGGLVASLWWIFRIREPRQYVGTEQEMINH
ncbi:TPA: hypothetical protein DCG86_07340 [Candidatus Marinimicrobia bacterium]|nr:MAG: Arabinose efflux permease family protein [Marinimicrobia bacterium 46_47]HAE87822.1 hypothetical protein [Candidatus Neomarinimicrobiota bacterium]HBY18842.1 hypothetical protein [Candidatus Neomarinimicrobiota bacterium]